MENDKLVRASDIFPALQSAGIPYNYATQRVIEQLPAVDAVEVRHGEWIIDETFGSFACSICGSWHSGGFDSWRSPYCPNCGAKMDGEEAHNAAD